MHSFKNRKYESLLQQKFFQRKSILHLWIFYRSQAATESQMAKWLLKSFDPTLMTEISQMKSGQKVFAN